MKVIIDHSRLHEAFSRMVDPALRSHNFQDHEEATLLRKSLAGDRVAVLEHCLRKNEEARFVVLRAEKIEGTEIDLYGVCLCDEAGRADLERRGLIAADEPDFSLLGPARFAAAEKNATIVRRAFTTHLQATQNEQCPFPTLTPLLPAIAARTDSPPFTIRAYNQ